MTPKTPTITLVLAAIIVLAAPSAMAQQCDADGYRGICEPDTWQPDPNPDQSCEDCDLDNGRDFPEISQPEPQLDNGRGDFDDSDR